MRTPLTVVLSLRFSSTGCGGADVAPGEAAPDPAPAATAKPAPAATTSVFYCVLMRFPAARRDEGTKLFRFLTRVGSDDVPTRRR